uniref:Small integral membrane protein 2 n=1 Tax=Balaenoptera musculus TaxID=9771 RepID=A0A8C0I3Y9_BALMU
KEVGERTDASQVPPGEVETRDHAISILFGFRMSFIYDTYIVLTWNKRIKRSPGASSSSDPHLGIQRSRRQSCTIEAQSLVPEAGL